ncbi:alpha/beta hydrolase, putative [Talaromyces stipitatus ATCC 10500]|uniref:Alpha/beta hydrolase, putative n=1 Tax=Talaromyces stipitatus (strain ATCC 10500 / CBS 375.48 / QM 6759 / NRRL 1006) TaxID=441959 RepID=B8M692_TALSN|nr:alpha/beta hydrolase, putative [Talaromyces stipitatus ATCC 10500]EED19267.1 alpha/beta hydrolase, putative [Talaromyces stipitatus ATCC 10500]
MGNIIFPIIAMSGPLRHHRLVQPNPSESNAVAEYDTKTWTNEPTVIIFPGAGESSSSWPRVQESVSRFARIFLYDRTGLGKSENYTHSNQNNKGAAIIAAEELCSLLDETRITGPYILVAHSYGAIVAREFLHLRSNEVAGMVLAEASTERQPQYFRLPDPNMTAVMANLKFSAVIGLRANARLSSDEWRTRAIEMSQSAPAIQEEVAGYETVCRQLGEKNQFKAQVLGDRPLSVIKCQSFRDYEKMYEAGLEVENGTEEQRQAFRRLLDNWDGYSEELQREQLQLSSNSRWVEVADCGHNVNILRPDVIVSEIRWVLGCKSTDELRL